VADFLYAMYNCILSFLCRVHFASSAAEIHLPPGRTAVQETWNFTGWRITGQVHYVDLFRTKRVFALMVHYTVHTKDA